MCQTEPCSKQCHATGIVSWTCPLDGCLYKLILLKEHTGIKYDLGTKQWEAPLNYCTMEYEVVCWVCTIAPTCTLVIHTHYWAPECHNGMCNTRMSVSAYMRAESSISISTSLFWPVLILGLKVPIPESRIRFCLNYLLVFGISQTSDLNVFPKPRT